MSRNNPHSGHRERLRKRFIETGISGFSDHEILELLLFNSIPRANTNPIAHALLHRFGSLSAVLQAPADELTTVEGIGASSAALLHLVGSIVAMLEDRKYNGVSPDYSAVLNKFFASAEAGSFIMIFADSSLGIISTRREKIADIISGHISVRQLLTDVLLTDARSVVIGISHGVSLPIPCEEDFKLIKLLSKPLESIGTSIADTVIYGSSKTYSMRQKSSYML